MRGLESGTQLSLGPIRSNLTYLVRRSAILDILLGLGKVSLVDISKLEESLKAFENEQGSLVVALEHLEQAIKDGRFTL